MKRTGSRVVGGLRLQFFVMALAAMLLAAGGVWAQGAEAVDISDTALVKITVADAVYKGDSVKSAVTVKWADSVLIKDSAYTVAYANNKNAGTAKVTVTGKAPDFTGTVVDSFTIAKAPLTVTADSVTITLGDDTSSYKFDAKIAGLVGNDSLKNLGGKLVFKCAFGTGSDTTAGTYDIVPDSLTSDNYAITFVKGVLTVKPKGEISIKDAVVTIPTIPTDTIAFTGDSLKPAVLVILEEDTLARDKAYTVAYTGNRNVGTATITVKGIGNYTDSTTKTFVIKPASISGFVVTIPSDSVAFTGDSLKPAVTVKTGTSAAAQTLANTDYTVAYTGNIALGTATITIKGTGNYTDSTTKTFVVKPASLKTADVAVMTPASGFIYNGSAHTPAVTVMLNGKTLVKDTSYTVAYANNIEVGTAAVTIIGKGNYADSTARTFVIEPAKFKVTFSVTDGEDGKANGKLKAEADTDTIASGDSVANYAKVVFTATPDKDYLVWWWKLNGGRVIGDGTESLTYTIAALKANSNVTVGFIHKDSIRHFSEDSTKLTIVGAPFVYSADSLRPALIIVHGKDTLKAGVDYVAVYTNNLNVGTANVTVTGIDFYNGKLNAEFAIGKKTPVVTDFEFTIPKDHVFTDDTLGIGEVKLAGTGSGKLTVYYNGVTSVPSDTGVYEVTVRVEEGDNYNEAIVKLGNYKIADTATIAIAVIGRDIPAAKVEVAAVTPHKAFAGKFTAGPNPTARAAGKVSLFWQGKALSSGTMTVFNASGSMVKKVAVADRAIGNSGLREIGAWNLTDAKGRTVAEGAYVVRGVLVAKDGSKIKVSSVISVR